MSQAQPNEVLYPDNNPVTTLPTSRSSSHSNGSFVPVFAVLAAILVISAVACVLGRFCKRRRQRSKEGAHQHHHHSKGHKQQSHHGLGPKEWETKQKPSYDMNDFGDIELGFGKGNFAGPKGGKNGGKDKSSHKNGGHKHQVRFDGDFSGN